MKKKWLKVLLPIAVVGVGFAGMTAIKATADVEEEKEIVDTRPTVKIDPLLSEDYQVTISKTEMVGKVYSEEEANAYYNEHQTQPPAPELKHLIDEKYSHVSAGLLFDVMRRSPRLYCLGTLPPVASRVNAATRVASPPARTSTQRWRAT